MNGDTTAVLLSWWPFVMLVGAWVLIVRMCRPRTKSGATMIDLYERHLAEAERTNAVLERIVMALEKR
jgi:hypothetical protein